MRIDDRSPTSQTQATTRTQADLKPGSKDNKAGAISGSPDEANISDVASALAAKNSRVEELRMQIEKGEYHVSAKDLAASIIKQHLK
jgi:anti-sigma28 factor (negative regulator of flagellin synthesis)